MKLITSSPKPQALPVIPVEAPALAQTDVQPGPVEDVKEYKVAFVADNPEVQAPIVWALPLTWKMAGLPRPELRMSKSVTDWCNYSTAFKNWLYTCLTVFVAAGIDQATVPVPDQFIDDLDRKDLHLEKIDNQIRILI